MIFCLGLVSIEILGMDLVLLLGLLFKYRYSRIEFITFSFFVGLGVISYLQFIFYLVSVRSNAQLIAIVVSMGLGLFIYLYLKSAKEIVTSIDGKPLDWIERLVILGLFIQAFCIIIHILPMPVQAFDSVANFSLKAKIFYLNEGIPGNFFNLSEYSVWHLDYPLLLPFYMTWIYRFIGFNDVLITKIMPVVYIMFLGLFYALLTKFFSRKYSLIAVFFLGTIPQLTRYAAIVYADLVLGACITSAFIYFILYLRDKKSAFLVNSALLFGVSVWIKNEALVFLAVFFIILAAKIACSKERYILLRQAILACLIILLVVSPWLVFKCHKGLINSDINLKVLTAGKFLKNLRDSPILLFELQREVFNPKKWNILWIIVISVFIWKRKMFSDGILKYAVSFVFLALLFYSCALFLTTSSDLCFHVEKELTRFMIHFAGIFIFLTAYLFQKEVFSEEIND